MYPICTEALLCLTCRDGALMVIMHLVGQSVAATLESEVTRTSPTHTETRVHSTVRP